MDYIYEKYSSVFNLIYLAMMIGFTVITFFTVGGGYSFYKGFMKFMKNKKEKDSF